MTSTRKLHHNDEILTDFWNVSCYNFFTDEIDVEIFDLLMSLGDFDEFKQLMLSHKKEKTAKLSGIVEPLTVFGTNLSSSKTA